MTKSKNKKNKNFFLKKYLKKIKNTKKKFILSELLTIITISILIGIILGSNVKYQTENIRVESVPKELEEFMNIYNDISSNYYDKTNKKELINSAMKAMVDSLEDPYSEYMEDEASKTFNENVNGEYVGIGATVKFDGTYAIVESMYDNSPAKKAGLKEKDILIEIDGKKIENLGLSEISKLIKGKSGTTVNVKVMRNQKEIELTIKREKIEVQNTLSKIIEKDNKKIGYISIDIFAANTAKQFEKELKSLEKKKIDSLIIDVRNNPGGHLSEVTNMLELFIKKGKVLYQIEKQGKVKKVKSTTKDSRKYNVVLLINNSSASASEIMASSLKEVYGATLVGEKTYGKGTVQTTYELSDGSTLKYTTQKWLTANGKVINEKGVNPDYDVELNEEYYLNPTDDYDNQLQKAIEILTTKKEENSK